MEYAKNLIWGESIPSINYKIRDIFCVTEKIKLSHKIEINHFYFATEENANLFIISEKLRPLYLDKQWENKKVRAMICEDGEVYLLGKSVKELYCK
jgi:hypothetical protein